MAQVHPSAVGNQVMGGGNRIMIGRGPYEVIRTLASWVRSRVGCRLKVILHPEPLVWSVQVGVLMMANEDID